MKTSKKFSTAKKYLEEGKAILKIHVGGEELYITNVEELDSITLVNKKGSHTGFVIAHHLNRLGNANHAKEEGGVNNYSAYNAYPKEG